MPQKIAILGTESSGKSALTEELAVYYDGDAVFEYAREYLNQSTVTYAELEHIAREQYSRENFLIQNSRSPYIFFDTDMINLQVWFDEVYGRMPEWLQGLDLHERYDFYLLTENDLEWIPDPLRTASDLSTRDRLRDIYQARLEAIQMPYAHVSGSDERRLLSAINAIDSWSAK